MYILYYPLHYFLEGWLFYFDMVTWNLILQWIGIDVFYYVLAIAYWVDPKGYLCAGPDDWFGRALERWARVDIYAWRLFFMMFGVTDWDPDLGTVYFWHATISQPFLLWDGFE